MANSATNRLKFELANGTADFDASDCRVLLLNTSATPNADTNVINDVVANEISVGGYSRQALTGETVTEDDTNDFAYFDANDVTFTALAAGQTIGWACLFRQTGSDATAPIYCNYDLTDTPTNGSDVTIVWATPANGGLVKLA